MMLLQKEEYLIFLSLKDAIYYRVYIKFFMQPLYILLSIKNVVHIIYGRNQ